MNQRIKVCHMSSAHLNTDRRIFVAECSSLAQEGFEVYFVARGESRKENGVQVIGVGDPPKNRLKRMLFFAEKVYRYALALDCEIYHLHDPELLPFALKLKRRGKSVIFDSHEFHGMQIGVKEYLPSAVAYILAKVYRIFENYVFRKIDGVIFPCMMQGKNPFNGKCRNTEIVNNTPLLGELYDKYDKDAVKEEKSICYMGTLTYDRGVTHMVKAAYHAGCKLYLAGTFYPAEYKDEIQHLKEYKCVHYLGMIDRSEIKKLLDKSLIGAATLLSIGQYDKCDNLPTKVYEFMSMGLPVVLYSTPYIESVLSEYRFGIAVNPAKIEDITEAFVNLINNPGEAKRMGIEGRRAIREKYNWNVDKEHLFRLYRKILEEKGICQ